MEMKLTIYNNNDTNNILINSKTEYHTKHEMEHGIENKRMEPQVLLGELLGSSSKCYDIPS